MATKKSVRRFFKRKPMEQTLDHETLPEQPSTESTDEARVDVVESVADEPQVEKKSNEPCPACSGTGLKDASTLCPVCAGRGVV